MIDETGFSPLGSALDYDEARLTRPAYCAHHIALTHCVECESFDYDARREAAVAWCEEHRDRVHAGGLTIRQAAGELLAGRLYDVDTGSAGHDCVIDADSEDEALELVADYAYGAGATAGMLRTKLDPWTVKLVTISAECDRQNKVTP